MTDYSEIFEAERGYLWGLLYRMTGSATDADDLLQDTFERAMTRPPDDTSRPWRPWLVRVATNLARDALRRRARRPYSGPWLPQPVPDELISETTPEARYGARESATLAFLKALEVLSPGQRTVLVLRDVFDYTTAETADALEMSTSNVKVTLHRARNNMASYDDRRPSTNADQVEGALRTLMTALLSGDAETAAEVLAEDVVFSSDSAGEFTAATRPVRGRDAVWRLMRGLVGKVEGAPSFRAISLNGLPALVVHAPTKTPGTTDRSVVRVDVVDGRVVAIDTILATDKLERVDLS